METKCDLYITRQGQCPQSPLRLSPWGFSIYQDFLFFFYLSIMFQVSLTNSQVTVCSWAPVTCRITDCSALKTHWRADISLWAQEALAHTLGSQTKHHIDTHTHGQLVSVSSSTDAFTQPAELSYNKHRVRGIYWVFKAHFRSLKVVRSS